jgi:hypothetical protein
MNKAQWEAIKKERDRLVEKLGAFPDVPQRAVTAVAKRLLLDAPYSYKGRSINPVIRSLGAGVYEVSNRKEE